jgi:hypothetical protein
MAQTPFAKSFGKIHNTNSVRRRDTHPKTCLNPGQWMLQSFDAAVASFDAP